MEPGRHTSLTEEKLKGLVDAYKMGASDCIAADLVCTHPRTIVRWRRRGEKDIENGDNDTVFARFCQLSQKAKAEYDISLISTMEKASHSQWTAAARLLESRRREFSRNSFEIEMLAQEVREIRNKALGIEENKDEDDED